MFNKIKSVVKIIQEWVELFYRDPVVHCDVHLEKGCSHVDGFLCDYPSCIILQKFIKDKNEKILNSGGC